MSFTPSTQTHQTTSTRSNNNPGKAQRSEGITLCGPCVKSFEIANEKVERKEKERTGPKPWLERKFAVGMVIALFGWSSYVFWGIILKHCWDRADDALVGFVGGVVLTVFYGFFTLMFLLTYLKILFTPPGFARDYVPRSEPPMAPEPPPFAYNRDPEGTYDPSHPTAYHNENNTITYPPSRKAPTSEYRPSMEDRLTHETASISLDAHHNEFDTSNTRLNVPSASTTVGIPYDRMPARPLPAHVHTRLRTTSNTAIPPSTPKPSSHQRSRSASVSGSGSGYPPSPSSPTTPTQAPESKPALLRKNSKRASASTIPAPTPASPTAQEAVKPQRPNRLRSASTGSRNTATSPVSPTSPTTPTARAASPTSPSSSSSHPMTKPPLPLPRSSSAASKRPAPPMTSTSGTSATGFQYESSSYIIDAPRPRLSSQGHSNSHAHSRTNSNTRNPTALPSPSHTSPQTPVPTPTPGMYLLTSSSHATLSLSERHTYEPDSRPIPYLDDLPPIAPSSGGEIRWERKPSEKPVLEPYYRYCSRDEIVKPPRAHHCRICNTCVLGYDHHCPWVGGCVGAQNRKFFVVFTFWCTLYLLYTLALLIASIISRTNPSRPVTFSTTSLDPNFIVLLVVSALFCVFSAGMLATHIGLLCHNASTVEWHSVQNMRERERAVISQVVPVCRCLGMSSSDPGNGGLLGRKRGELRWDEEEVEESGRKGRGRDPGLKGFKGRKELRKRWDREWGRIGKEGNLWWLGSNRKNWETVMGKNPWTWLLPIGDVSGVGVDYPRNPRFDEQGRWMKRKDWPQEIR